MSLVAHFTAMGFTALLALSCGGSGEIVASSEPDDVVDDEPSEIDTVDVPSQSVGLGLDLLLEPTITMASARGGDYDLVVVVPSSGSSFGITDSGTNETFPAWSPSSETLAFVSDRSGSDEIWLMSESSGQFSLFGEWQGDEMDLKWSSDGGSIGFSARIDDRFLLHVWDQGGSPRSVTPEATSQINWSWSPVDRFIACQELTTAGSMIVVIDADGGDRFELGAGSQPSWSPDGDEVFFSSDRHGGLHLWSWTMQDQALRQLTSGDGTDVRSVAAPDGSWIAYMSDALRPTFFDILRLDLPTLRVSSIYELGANQARELRWAPDASAISFRTFDFKAEEFRLGILGLSDRVPRDLGTVHSYDWRPVRVGK